MRAIEASNSPDSPDPPDSHGGEQSGVCVHHCACVFAGAFFFAFLGVKDASTGFRSACIEKAPKRALFGPYRMAHRWTVSRAWGDVLSPRRKASAQDAPACLRGVPDATSAVAHLP